MDGKPRDFAPHGATLSDRSAFIALLLLVLAALAWRLAARPDASYSAQFLPEIAAYFPAVDSVQRQWAHRLLVLAIPLLLLVPAIGSVRVPAWFVRLTRALRPWLPACFALVSIAGMLYQLPASVLISLPDWNFGHVTYLSKTSYAVAILCGFALVTGLARIVPALRSPHGIRVLWTLCGAYALVGTVPALITPAPFFRISWQSLLWFDSHYQALFGEALRLAQGQVPFADFDVYYGLLRQALLALWIKYVAPLDWGGMFRVVQWSQVLYVALAVAAFAIWRPRRPLAALVGLLLIMPWVHPLHVSVASPNQSGMRHAGIAIALLLMLLARRTTPPRAALGLGAGAGALIALNPETGIAATFGFLVFLAHRAPSLKISGLLRPGFAFVAGALAAFAAFLCALLLIGGRVPGPGAWAVGLRFIADSAAGFSGGAWTFDPVFILVATHCFWVLLRLAIRRAARPSGPEAAFLAGAAAVAFAWLAYYVNRPDPWYLWPVLLPYSFVLGATFLDPHRLRALPQSLRPAGAGALRRLVTLPTVGLAVVLFPAVFAGNWNLFASISIHLAQAQTATAVPVAGLPLRPEVAAFLDLKGKTLRELDHKAAGKLVFLTSNSLSMPVLAARPSGLRVRDPFHEVFGPRQFQRLVEELNRSPAQFVLFDDTSYTPTRDTWSAGIWFPEPQKQFYDRIKQSISARYQYGYKAGGWEIWARRP